MPSSNPEMYTCVDLRRREEWSLPPLRKRLSPTTSIQSPLAAKKAKVNTPGTPKKEEPNEVVKEDRIIKSISSQVFPRSSLQKLFFSGFSST